MLTGFAVNSSTITLQWEDNSSAEMSFEIQIKQNDGDFRTLGFAQPNTVEVNITRLTPGHIYSFQIAAVDEEGTSSFSNTFEQLLRVLVLVESAEYFGVAGEAFSQTFTFRDTATDETFAATSANLPDGLVIDPTTGTVSGTLTGGQYTGFSVTPAAQEHAHEQNVVLDVDAAPVIIQEAKADILVGATTVIDLDKFFKDPDTASTVRFETAEGTVDVGLFNDTAPNTVRNFYSYADPGTWNGTFIHRAAKLQDGTPFVNQGGGYRPIGDGTYESIPDRGPIDNEFSRTRPNGKGTISMAKAGGNPNSATNEWFFSLTNNTRILDPQNGGFTVFGKVLGDGMTVLSRINDLPRDTYEFSLDGFDRSFADWPLRNGATSVANPDDLVSVSSVHRVPSLSYIVTTPMSTPFTSSIAGSMLTLEAAIDFTGTVPISIGASDLDGHSSSHTFSITAVSEPTSFATYAAKFGIQNEPLANDDGDTLTAIIEYALGLDPTTNSSQLPTVSDAGDTPTLSFPLITDLDEIVATVETSIDAEIWSTAWSSLDGLTPAGNLVSVLPDDIGILNQITVSSGRDLEEHPQQFMRLRVSMN